MNLKTSKRTLLLTLICILPWSTQLTASEVDSFHKRYTEISDSTEAINQKTNELLAQAVAEANRTFFGCSERFLYRNLRRYFRNHVLSEMGDWIVSTDKIERITVPIEESIYQDFNWRAPIQGIYAQRFKDPTGELIRMGEHLIGSDKFEHFMGTGYRYFDTYHLDQAPIEEALEIGWNGETGLMGAWTTGVLSYGDLVANFQGMRFWNHILAKDEDVFGPEQKYNPGPYIRCQNRDWVIVSEIDWTHYIDHAWDEGINCSKFRTQKMTDSVLARIEKLEQEEGRRFTCPIYPEKREQVLEKYAPFQPWLINPYGHETMTDHRQRDVRI